MYLAAFVSGLIVFLLLFRIPDETKNALHTISPGSVQRESDDI